jgi:hypothetical protein
LEASLSKSFTKPYLKKKFLNKKKKFIEEKKGLIFPLYFLKGSGSKKRVVTCKQQPALK